jgi:hypothetical protein
VSERGLQIPCTRRNDMLAKINGQKLAAAKWQSKVFGGRIPKENHRAPQLKIGPKCLNLSVQRSRQPSVG